MLREFGQISYLPILAVRPAEMVALQSLPERDKDLMAPLFRLQPWVGALHLQSALDRLREAYGSRPHFIMLSEPELAPSERPVHRELAALRDPANGFDAWCRFAEGQGNYIPALQLTDVGEFDVQAHRLHALNRGLIVPIERAAFQFIRAIASRTAAATNRGDGVVFLLDWGRQTRTLLLQEIEAVGFVREILNIAPNARVALSASTFPESFTTINSQEIYERQFFNVVQTKVDRTIYSDRGSARAERQSGGGGAPAPRIDYAGNTAWTFFRSSEAYDRPAAYQEQAERLVHTPSIWDPNLRIWGTQMIERTALGDNSAIISPARSTAARINIHLHRQLHYDNPSSLYLTDDDWTD